MTPSKYICIASSIFLLHVLFSSANEGERNISIPPAVQNNNGLTLKQCFEKAVQQSETLKIQGENVAQSKARYQQATSGILPTIKWNWTNTTQDTSGVSTGSSGGDQTLARRSRTDSRFFLNQRLFSGFKESAGRRSIAAEEKQRLFLLNRENVTLFQDVASTFYDIIRAESDLKNIRTILGLSDERDKELKSRARLGKSRETEILSSESQRASLKSKEVTIQGNLAIARERLSYLVGEDITQTPLIDEMTLPESPLTIEEALKQSELRSDIQAAIQNVESMRYGIKVARADFWPAAGVIGNYYTQRSGFLRDVDWDVVLSVDVPLFQGGLVSGRVKEARSKWKQAQMELSQLRRLIQTEVKQAHLSLTSTLAEATSLKESHDKADRSYEALVKEYRLGLVNNLEVLQALNTLQDVKQNLDDALVQSKLNWINLNVSIEGIQ